MFSHCRGADTLERINFSNFKDCAKFVSLIPWIGATFDALNILIILILLGGRLLHGRAKRPLSTVSAIWVIFWQHSKCKFSYFLRYPFSIRKFSFYSAYIIKREYWLHHKSICFSYFLLNLPFFPKCHFLTISVFFVGTYNKIFLTQIFACDASLVNLFISYLLLSRVLFFSDICL